MQPTSILAGARRLALSGKRANKDFYKGTGQSRTPGGGHKTGAPGLHVVKGKAKYRLVDEKVRVFIGPGATTLETTELKPYVATRDGRSQEGAVFFDPFRRGKKTAERLPSFSPNVEPAAPGERITPQDRAKFSKRYARLSTEQKQALVMDSRRKWWEGMQKRYGEPPEDEYRSPADFEESSEGSAAVEGVTAAEGAEGDKGVEGTGKAEGAETAEKKGTNTA